LKLAPSLGLVLTMTAALEALGHAGERGFILLLPTGLYQTGGATAVAVSFVVVTGVRTDALRRALAARWVLPLEPPPRVPGSNAAATVVLAGLVVAGFAAEWMIRRWKGMP